MKAQSKVVELEELSKIAQGLKEKGKKIVLSNGVFDLLHIGHIRHLKEAKTFGNVLIVTITSDAYVGKGPHRPVFTEKLRAEMLASLDFIDYIAINKQTTAEKAIKLLKPDFYVKGPNYKERYKDTSKSMLEEENAVKEAGGEIKITDNIAFSSTNLINKHLPVLPKEVRDYLEKFTQKYTSEEIVSYLENIKNLKILVVGEAIIDEYRYGVPIGKAGKESIIALKYLSSEKFAGGSLAIANHLANFCDNIGLFTLLGDTKTQEEFVEKKLNKNIARFFHYKKDSPTIVKRRFVEAPTLRKLFETYIINDNQLNEEQSKEVQEHLKKILPQYDLVVVSDFGHGMLDPEIIKVLIENSKFLAVNTQTNAGNMGYNTISKYPNIDYVCIDEPEIRLEARDKTDDLKKIMSTVAEKVSCEKMSITRGIKGCMGYSKGTMFNTPAFSDKIIDTMGAGDAFLSITAPLVANNVPLDAIGFIGNTVGSMAVTIVGNKESIEKKPLYNYIISLMK